MSCAKFKTSAAPQKDLEVWALCQEINKNMRHAVWVEKTHGFLKYCPLGISSYEHGITSTTEHDVGKLGLKVKLPFNHMWPWSIFSGLRLCNFAHRTTQAMQNKYIHNNTTVYSSNPNAAKTHCKLFKPCSSVRRHTNLHAFMAGSGFSTWLVLAYFML